VCRSIRGRIAAAWAEDTERQVGPHDRDSTKLRERLTVSGMTAERIAEQARLDPEAIVAVVAGDPIAGWEAEELQQWLNGGERAVA
jgi:hypothetical protein